MMMVEDVSAARFFGSPWRPPFGDLPGAFYIWSVSIAAVPEECMKDSKNCETVKNRYGDSTTPGAGSQGKVLKRATGEVLQCHPAGPQRRNIFEGPLLFDQEDADPVHRLIVVGQDLDRKSG
jgi:hypothetical protein